MYYCVSYFPLCDSLSKTARGQTLLRVETLLCVRILIKFSKLSRADSVAIISVKNTVGTVTLKGFLFFLPRKINPNSYLETETLRERMPV